MRRVNPIHDIAPLKVKSTEELTASLEEAVSVEILINDLAKLAARNLLIIELLSRGHGLSSVGRLAKLSRERIRQIRERHFRRVHMGIAL
jgi:DNA-directed RNA polymerase sigma subunit (sigma70/sigma32)